MFPYFDEGSIVPCTATFKGGPKVDYSRFQHFNTVDEILLTFGADGSMRGGGLLRVGARLHMVQSPLADTSKLENLALAVITQRQSVGQTQKEEYRFVCEKMRPPAFHESVRRDTPETGQAEEGAGSPPGLRHDSETYFAAKEFNADPTARVCKHCGHKNKPFPIEAWGWDHYVEQSEISATAYDAMMASQKAPPRPAAGGRK